MSFIFITKVLSGINILHEQALPKFIHNNQFLIIMSVAICSCTL